MRLAFCLRAIAAVTATAIVSACAAHPSTALIPQEASFSQRSPRVVPAACIGQTNKAKHSYVTQSLNATGGTACIPSFGGFGGTIGYPELHPAVQVKFTSATTKYQKDMPSLGEGTALFYLQMNDAVVFFGKKKTPTRTALVGKALKPGKSYTAFAATYQDNIVVEKHGCNAVATKDKAGGALNLGTILNNRLLTDTPSSRSTPENRASGTADRSAAHKAGDLNLNAFSCQGFACSSSEC